YPYSADLDVFGQFSLFSLLNHCSTTLGVAKLAGWLQRAENKQEIEDRQVAMAEIAADLEWSQHFQARLLFNARQEVDMKSFLANYFKRAVLIFGIAFIRLSVSIAPFLLLVGVLFSLLVLPIWTGLIVWGLVHLCWTLAMACKVSLFSSRIDKVGQILAAYAE